jgi:hypothetical protein
MLKKAVYISLLLVLSRGGRADVTTFTGNIQDISCMLEIGYYVNVEDQTPMLLERVANSADPFRTYYGCRTTAITCNFTLSLNAHVRATSVAEGDWSVNFSHQALSPGTTNVEFCVRGENVHIERLQGGGRVKVAELRIGVVPLE